MLDGGGVRSGELLRKRVELRHHHLFPPRLRLRCHPRSALTPSAEFRFENFLNNAPTAYGGLDTGTVGSSSCSYP
ncbi:hypothetical protein FIBSPDRAFT_1045754 [Athelia psychrophila]|uniref:Uncharacterized protein n=1 Tax=Athelia psychrophila TaxID=1759441 RepID=A0A166HLI4_9AGAM|nr:hypothetical protein FIBSPDRAFT_1045754 [Fibularhizoctonia sp. CBS 109695]